MSLVIGPNCYRPTLLTAEVLSLHAELFRSDSGDFLLISGIARRQQNEKEQIIVVPKEAKQIFAVSSERKLRKCHAQWQTPQATQIAHLSPICLDNYKRNIEINENSARGRGLVACFSINNLVSRRRIRRKELKFIYESLIILTWLVRLISS